MVAAYRKAYAEHGRRQLRDIYATYSAEKEQAYIACCRYEFFETHGERGTIVNRCGVDTFTYGFELHDKQTGDNYVIYITKDNIYYIKIK